MVLIGVAGSPQAPSGAGAACATASKLEHDTNTTATAKALPRGLSICESSSSASGHDRAARAYTSPGADTYTSPRELSRDAARAVGPRARLERAVADAGDTIAIDSANEPRSAPGFFADPVEAALAEAGHALARLARPAKLVF